MSAVNGRVAGAMMRKTILRRKSKVIMRVKVRRKNNQMVTARRITCNTTNLET
jgi:hypothetical protein